MAQDTGFDTAAAVTRSMLGWGVVAGPFYLVFGLILALTREGFDISRHPLSVLMLGDGGWLQAVFPPDPMAGFPPGQDGASVPGLSGVLHLAFGGVGFVAVAVAALLLGGWLGRRGERGRAIWSRVAGVVVLVGFLGGAALGPAGMGGLWLAVVVGFAWLLLASVRLYRAVPHPDLGER